MAPGGFRDLPMDLSQVATSCICAEQMHDFVQSMGRGMKLTNRLLRDGHIFGEYGGCMLPGSKVNIYVCSSYTADKAGTASARC